MENSSKLEKKPLTLVQKACNEIHGFKNLYNDLDDKIRISGQSPGTLEGYSRKLAQISLHFGKLPQHISEKEINEYLADIARKSPTPSMTFFKTAIYSLRYCYRMIGMSEKAVQLPSIKYERKLPVVLNHNECKSLFSAPAHLKHRILLSLIYSAGLRVQEASNLKISDIDSGRMMIHIRQSKYKKDRYVPLSPLILEGLRKYYFACRPVDYLFNGQVPGSKLSTKSIQFIIFAAKKKSKLIRKRISIHTLRHTYAVHLLENGMDVVTIKELLGHKRIETTMLYLEVFRPNRSNLFSPFDRLYKKN